VSGIPAAVEAALPAVGEVRARASMGGRVVALLEARRQGELARLVETYGGRPILAPAVREEPVADYAAIAALLDSAAAAPFQVAVFQTGVGTKALVQGALALGRDAELRAALESATVVTRGPKPVAALREERVRVDIRTPEPYTTPDMLTALASTDLAGRRVFVQHYGERNLELVNALAARGADLLEAELYRWTLPDDTGPLETLLQHELMTARVDALVVTSQVQVRHLCQVADRLGLRATLPDLLDRRVVMVAVGPVAARAIVEHGLRVDLQPEHPKMGALVQELAQYFERRPPLRRIVCPE
jgi:uroporphyrinogen-III synthase